MSEPFDMRTIQRGARLRRSPYFEATQRAGCWGYTVYNHMFLPIGYAGQGAERPRGGREAVEAEYWKLVRDVTVWDVAVERQVEITGRDAYAFTSLLTPRDLAKCRVGQGKYVLITAEDGGIVNDPVLLRLADNHFWLALADSDVLLWARGLACRAGFDVEIREPDVSPLQVQGPKSGAVVQALFGDGVLELRYYHFVETELDGIPVVVTRTGWSGEVGYEIYLRDGSRGLELWDRVMEAGHPHGIAATGPSDIRRVEAGILNYGADMTLEDNPYQVGLERLVDLEKSGDFIGKEALRRTAAEGVHRKLVGVELEGEPLDLNMTRWPVKREGEPVGYVTSALWSPRLERNVGYAMVGAEHAALGTALTVETPQGDAGARVAIKPFLDPAKDIPRRPSWLRQQRA